MKNQNEEISVVLCAKNEEIRIAESIKGILKNNVSQLIIVDGNSTDKTYNIASKFDCKIIKSFSNSLTKDRQIGIDACNSKYVAMIDADHYLESNSIRNLLEDLIKFNFDIIQSKLEPYDQSTLLGKAEKQLYDITHNNSGPKKMIGTAPAIYNKKIFEEIKFDEKITAKMDDTDFIYRLSKLGKYKYGVGNTIIKQYHINSFFDYYRKYIWYGRGDGEFIRKYPYKIFSILNNLIINYLIAYPLKSLVRFKFLAIPFSFFQGITRLFGLIKYFVLTQK